MFTWNKTYMKLYMFVCSLHAYMHILFNKISNHVFFMQDQEIKNFL